MTLREYLDAVRHKTVAVVGIGVSNDTKIANSRFFDNDPERASPLPPATSGRGSSWENWPVSWKPGVRVCN